MSMINLTGGQKCLDRVPKMYNYNFFSMSYMNKKKPIELYIFFFNYMNLGP